MIRVFIGYDEKETVAAHVLHHSIQRQSSMPVNVTFLNRDTLKGLFTRPRGQYDSTDFSISRFLVPYLCNYEGFGIFMDCDMLCRDDIAKLWAWRNERYAVQVVKHNHLPQEDVKFLGQVQTKYLRKNWSSLMIFNCAHQDCRALDLDYVNTAPGLALHQFNWTLKDAIGEIPHHWNHLVGYDDPNPNVSMPHYTSGGPYFEKYRNCEHGEDWKEELLLMNHVADD